MTPTSEQLAILDAAKTGDSLMIEAMAGTGKTSAICMLAKVLPVRPSLALAFNVKIRDELKKKLPTHFEVLTLNSLGHRAWSRALGRRCIVKTSKLGDTIKEIMKENSLPRDSWSPLYSLVRAARHAGLIPDPISQQFHGIIPDEWESWEALADAGYVDLSDELMFGARQVLLSLIRKGFQGEIDYDDQIYLSCQPAGTMVSVCNRGTQGWTQVPIEQVVSGDKVVSFNRRGGRECSIFTGLYSHGSLVTKIGNRLYTGDMYTINAGNFITKATAEHKWLIRFSPELRKRSLYFTYLMLRDGSFRIGQTQIRSIRPGSTDGLGLAVRCALERADAAWILGVHNNQQSALTEEAIISAQFGITDKSFVSDVGLVVHDCQRVMPNLVARAEQCLKSFSRDIRFPFWKKNATRGFASNFITQSCNLIPEIMEVPTFHGKKEPRWEKLHFSRVSVVDEQVFSLEVNWTELYIADNILTHNSLFGGSFPKFAEVMVDEAQDLSPLNHKQVQKVASDRLIVVGDSRQAIYAFRGADSSSMESLRGLRESWKTLSLSTTFRCPRSVVARQQTHAPGFNAHESAPQGEIRVERGSWSTESISKCQNVAILCRNNAPIIAAALRIIRSGVGCTVLGRDVGTGLISLSKKILPHDNASAETCISVINAWAEKEISLQKANKKPERVSQIKDRAECLLAVIDSGRALTARDIRDTLSTMFARENNRITLSTGHKAKGLEFDTVISLDPWRIPSKYALRAEEEGNPIPIQQDRNLNYVIETRTKNTLILANLEGMTC